MKKTFFIVVIAFLGIFFVIKRKAPQVSSTVPDTLIVGTSADFQPFCFKETDNIVGFDIDVVTEVAKRLNKKIEFKDMPFELLVPQLQLGSIHIIAACMTPTPERAQRVLFSKPYLTTDHLVVITPADMPITKLADLEGKKVIVNQGYTSDRYMSQQKGISLMRLPSVSDAMLALKSARADAFVVASKAIQPYFEQHPQERYQIFVIEDAVETTALAISPLQPLLAQEIDAALETMKADGTLQNIIQKWRLA